MSPSKWKEEHRLPSTTKLKHGNPFCTSNTALDTLHILGFQARTAATALRSEDYGYGAEATPLRSKLSSTVKPFLQHNGKLKETLHLLDQHELQPEFSIFTSLLGECSLGKILTDGRRIHSHIIRSALDRKMFLGNLLIKMYGICGDPVDAQAVFNRMQSRNVITWTLIMDAYIQHGDHMEAIHVYQEMHRAGVKPNSITLVSILTASSLHQGKMIHACVVEYGFERDVILGTALINMYQKCGCLESARQLFDRMGSRDVIAWNTLIAAYIHHGKFDDSIHLYLQMQQNVEPNHVSFITVLGACCSPAMVLQGLSFHACIVENGVESDVAIGAALVTMYGKCKSAEDAQSVFEKVHPRNVILWNAMITAYAESGHDSEALCLYEQMKGQEVKPNHVTFINALSASAALASLSHGMDIHGSIISHSLESQTLVGTALFNMYGKCGCIKSARRVFDKLLFQDLVMWNAMLSVYILNGHAKEAFQLYHQMLGDNMVPDRFTFNTLLSACCRPAALRQGQGIHSSIIMYGVEGQAGVGAGLVGMYNKCGSVEAARSAFERQHRKDLALWNTMLTGYMQCNLGKEAILLYQKMGENSVKPDGFTFSAVLGACSSLAALAQGKEIHAAVVDGGYDSECAVKNALVHMYSKCGNMADAWSVFEKHHDQDVISWNAMISGYAQHGYGKEALQVYRKMQTREIKANNVTFVGVFSACAHVGLVEEGLEYFDSMKKVSGITPGLEHYACIVDLFGRVGRIEEAEEFLNQIPIQPDVVVWKVLLGSCKVHNDIRRGRGAAEHAVEYDSENTQAYVLLSNIYAAYEDLSWTGLELEEGLATMQLDYT